MKTARRALTIAARHNRLKTLPDTERSSTAAQGRRQVVVEVALALELCNRQTESLVFAKGKLLLGW